MNGSSAAIEPPFLKVGEIQAMRPPTSALTVALPSSVTAPVTSTVSACAPGAGRITATVGVPCSRTASETNSLSPLGACAK